VVLLGELLARKGQMEAGRCRLIQTLFPFLDPDWKIWRRKGTEKKLEVEGSVWRECGLRIVCLS
jgi:hypothetical protein